MGYYVGYLRDQLPLESVEWNAMTHVAVSAATPKPDGSLDTSFYQQDKSTGEQWASSVVKAAHSRGKKAVLMLGGAGSRAAFASAASASHRAAFVANILATADRLGFDGVDMDWEPMQATDVPDAVAVGRELKARRPALLLTIPVGAVNTNLPQLAILPSIASLGSVYDQINVMSYGMNGGWEGWSSWHSSALYGETTSTPMSVDSSIRAYAAAGIPRSKLGVGVGFFGTCMSGVTAPRQNSPTFKVVADDNVMSYANIMSHYYRQDLARWDDVAKAPYLTSSKPIGPAGCTLVSYEDQRSVAEKAKYVKANNLGGVVVWNINEGYPTSTTTTVARSRRASSPSLLASVGRSLLS